MRRGLRRASVKMMHSQSYDIFDKVNLYHDLARGVCIAGAEGRPGRQVFRDQPHGSPAGEDRRRTSIPTFAKDILKAERRPAEEVDLHDCQPTRRSSTATPTAASDT